MAIPKKNRTNPFNQSIGKERQQELIDMIADKSVYLPKSVKLRDLDSGIRDYIKENLKLIVENKEVPIFFLTKEKWSDLQLTWRYNDDQGNIVMPFITVRRSEPPKQGSNENIKYRIPQNKQFVYTKVPTYNNGVFGVDIYKTPQPTPIDMMYEVRLFTHYTNDLNLFNENIQFAFASGQSYMMINGYYIPIMLDNVADESTINDFEGNSFYCQVFTLKVQGFIQNCENFEIINGIRRAMINLKEK